MLCALSYCHLGKLGPPQNLSIRFDESTHEIIVTWEKPLYVLQGIKIARYDIIGNVTCFYSGTYVEYINGTNVTDHTYVFPPNENCRDYNITVHLCVNAVTAAGQGQEKCENKTILPNGETTTNCFVQLPEKKFYHDFHVICMAIIQLQ